MDEARYRAAEQALWASVGASATDRFLDLPGAGLRIRVQELGDGPPILFIHGANTSGASWATLATKLPAFRCLLLDRPGTGLSEAFPVRPTTTQLMALGDDLVADVLDVAGIARAHVVATSLGGLLALRSAAAHPDRVLRMVQFSWPVGAPTGAIPRSMRLMAIPGAARLVAAIPASEGPYGRSSGPSGTGRVSTQGESRAPISTPTWPCSGTPTPCGTSSSSAVPRCHP
ncbi:MAG: alpha/beta fold hydrolase [Candidatus Limnocylindria bacterium]